MIQRRSFLQSTTAAAASLAFPALSQAQSKRPNIVVIMADDMGFSDAGCFGGEIRTPNIDRLAKEGLRFTQFYNCARCCPTRASLMTGLYPHQAGLALNGRNLSRNAVTIAEALKPVGYRTAMSGKWHLSQTIPLKDKEKHQQWLDHRYDPGVPFAPLETYPVNRGFEQYFGNIWGVVDYFDPFSLVDGTKPVKDVPDDFYMTDAINQKAADYIQDFSRSDDPFFLYVAQCAPHWPLHALEEDIARYRGRYDAGWHELRRERYRRMLGMRLFYESNTPLPPIDGRNTDWDGRSAEERRILSGKMTAHAAMVDRMDQGVGKILQALERTGQMDNTLIVFLVDNGASPELMTGPGYDRTSMTRDGRKVKYHDFEHVGQETTYTCIGPSWASAGNTPFRYWKKESYEGGCHTPAIVHWPKGLKTEAGSICEQPAHVMDIMPTCLELAGAKYPKTYQGHDITPLEGKSLLPILQGKEREGHKQLCFEHEGGRAIRIGDWKLVAYSRQSGDWHLYNLAEDRTETKNLAAKYPERVTRMKLAWNQWAKRVGVEM